ncbi:hypothetical protein ACFPC0_11210 [Streptomyces andamanensis]|uniref:Uncharacterized protein n=1 Tax=Streptomyces andamanensis TaxID=1565035 RepID=A0ABV8TCN2_9ACTN
MDREPTQGKKPWYARPRTTPARTVESIRSLTPTDEAPEGYTEDVALSLVINEPGKGSGHTAPRREIRTPLNTDDAFLLGLRLIEEAISAEQRNTRKNGTGRPAYFEHETGPEDRRMPLHYAEANELAVAAIRGRLTEWQRTHPDIADYRVTSAIQYLGLALRYLGYLSKDATPDLDATIKQLDSNGFFTTGTEPRQTLTGDPAADHPAERGLVPKMMATGTYHETMDREVRVQVQGLSTSYVLVVPLGKGLDDAIEIPRNPSDLFTLTLDNETDWVSTEDEALEAGE